MNLQTSKHSFEYIKNIFFVYLLPNLKFLQKGIAMISICFSKMTQYTTMFIGHDRKMVSEFR